MTGEDDERGGWVLLVARGLQVLVAVLAVYGAVDGQFDLLINATLALALTGVPAFLAWRYDHDTDPRLALWIAAAAALHSLGFLGPYGVHSGPLSLYDQLAHATSASLVAGTAYAMFVGLDRSAPGVRLPPEARAAFTVIFVLAFGVAWEVVEFGAGWLTRNVVGQEALVQYGVDDVVLDIAFNTIAAAAVALRGTGYFRGLAGLFGRRIDRSERS